MSSVGGDTSRGLLLPFFDGEPNKFKGWWMRFKSYATIKKFSQAIQRVAEKDLPADEATDVSSDQMKTAARNRNFMAISCLTMAFQDDALLNMIEQSETADWPSGLAYLVVDELFKKYRLVDIISRVEMRTKLSKVTKKPSDDPRVQFNQLASIQSMYNSSTQKIDPYDLIAVVLEKALDKYKSILTVEQRAKGTQLSLTDLNNCMNDLYRTMNPNHADTKDDKEVALAATTTTKFISVCGKCKKQGHMARYCKQKKSDDTGIKNLRPCRHCGGKHMDYKCWELPQNAKNRPSNWVSRKTSESANVAADVDTGHMVELPLSNIDDEPQAFSHQQDILLQPGIWIGDTAATVHITSPRRYGEHEKHTWRNHCRQRRSNGRKENGRYSVRDHGQIWKSIKDLCD
jgi:DNA-directed RNA polymerase subunit M/transcription elongation factor TFIIS